MCGCQCCATITFNHVLFWLKFQSRARRARILYWIAHAQRAAGKSAESERTLDALARDHPLSIYTFMARPGAVRLLDGENPSLDS